MGLVIGTDEAGYGPNLGPLVITATAWRVPGDPRSFDFWSALEEVVINEAPRKTGRLHVADSKQVYSPGKGLRELERSVLSLLSLLSPSLLFPGGEQLAAGRMREGEIGTNAVSPSDSPSPALRAPSSPQEGEGTTPTRFRELFELVTGAGADDVLNVEPWFCDADLQLPVSCEADGLPGLASGLHSVCSAAGIELVAVRSDVVLTERFNRLASKYNSKGAALSRMTMQLIRSVWDPDSTEPVVIISDKHGGRNRYDDLIDEQLDGQMIFRMLESRQKSTYRIGKTEMHFQQGAERHFPAAVSSMICKYLRELSMELFNTFWREHLPDLQPTKGYPLDAKRFRAEIAEIQRQLEIADSTLWRAR